jgi:hypothetical protein
VISGVSYGLNHRLLMWRRSGKDVDGDNIWLNLREFSGWMSVGCTTGVVGFGLQMIALDYEFQGVLASYYRYYAASGFLVSVHLLCVVYAMCLLLRRVSDHASHSYYNVARDNESGRTTDDGKFDWRDCVGQYASGAFPQRIYVTSDADTPCIT